MNALSLLIIFQNHIMINNGFFVKKPLTASEHFDEKTQQHNELHIYKTF